MRKTLLILHGWGSCAKKWEKVKQGLEGRELKVLVPDLPGFGEAPPPFRPWSVNDYVEWVREHCEEQKISQFFLLGHSFGGRIAIKFAIKYPQKLRGLILCASPIRKNNLAKSYLIFRAVKFAKNFSFIPGYQLFRKIFYKYILRKTDYLEAKGVMKETFKKVINEDLTSFLSEIRAKTLILWGKKDRIVSVKIASEIKEKVLNSKLIIMPEVGHSPHMKVPEKLSEILIDFISAL